MNELATILSIPTSIIEWMFSNYKPATLLLMFIWALWSYFTWLTRKFGRIDHRLDKIEGKLPLIDTLAEGQHKLQVEVVRLEGKIDNLADTMDGKFTGVDDQFVNIDRRFDEVDKKFEAIDKKFEAIDKRFEVIDRKFEKVDARFDKLEEKIDAKFNAQQEINLEILSYLRGQKKSSAVTVLHPDIEERLSKLEHKSAS
jgi:chromosome segregation ATPase